MNHPEFFLVSMLRALVEVALLTLLGQGALGLLAGAGRMANPVYRLFQVITGPAIKAVRRIAPPQVSEERLPFLAFVLLLGLWLFLAYLKQIV